MELQLPGKHCVEQLLRAYEKVGQGLYALPLEGILRVQNDALQTLIPLELVMSIERVGTSEDMPTVKITLLVRSDVPWEVKFGKDAKGEHIFTDPSLDE